METECRVPLLGKRAPGLPRVAVKLDRPFGGLGERGDAAPARVAAVADRPAVVQRLPAGLRKRHFGIRPEPDRSQAAFDPDALPPRLRDAAINGSVNPETQPAPAAPVPVHAGPTDRPHERGGERSRSLRHAFFPQWCITYCITTRERIHGMSANCKGQGDTYRNR